MLAVVLYEVDLFAAFRWLLLIFCTVYTSIRMWQVLIGWLIYFRSDRYTGLLGRYTAALLLRMRLTRFRRELLEIAGLLVVLCGLFYLHHLLLSTSQPGPGPARVAASAPAGA